MPTQLIVLIPLLKIFIVTPADEVIPATVAVVLVDDNVLIVLPLIFPVVGAEVLTIAVTAPPLPVEDKLVIELLAIVKVATVPLLPCCKPTIVPVPVILEIVLEDILVVPPKLFCKTFTADEPHVQLLNVLPVIVFIGVAPVPSVLFHPATVVAPVTVIFEKLLLLLVIPAVARDEPPSVYNVTVPPATPLLKAVAIELLFIVFEPPEGALTELEINVTLPDVLTLRFVKVFELIF